MDNDSTVRRGVHQAMHTCPADGCTVRIPNTLLMCRRDWGRVPKPLRDGVWATYAHGRGAGSPAHMAAVRDAIEALRAQDRELVEEQQASLLGGAA